MSLSEHCFLTALESLFWNHCLPDLMRTAFVVFDPYDRNSHHSTQQKSSAFVDCYSGSHVGEWTVFDFSGSQHQYPIF